MVNINDIENDFLLRINKKKEEAFHDLFIRFHSYLVLFAVRRVGQTDIAEDIVQDVFINVWGGKKTFNSYQGLKAYLYKLVQNACINFLKHKEVEEKYASYARLQEDCEEEDYNLMQEEVYRELYAVVRELPEKCRKVFELHLEGMKNDEIADKLGISVLTVKSHKQNAIQFLKGKIGLLLFVYSYIMDNRMTFIKK